MKIIIAEHAGFCAGVKRAVKMAEKSAGKQPLVSLGPLIHSQHEVQRLQRLGVGCTDEAGLSDLPKETWVVIRSHGVGPQVVDSLKEQGLQVIDATCPFVSQAQKLAAQAADEGYQVIILGDKEHAEVKGLSAWTGNKALVVSSWEELEGQELAARVAVLAQTTEKEARFEELVDYLKRRVPEVNVLSTICKATQDRQNSARKLAQEVDVMLVIGGRHSSNTQKLWEICNSLNPASYLIEDAGDLNLEWLKNKKTIGITAGASTPAWVIEEVVKKMEMQENMEQNEKEMEFKDYKQGDIVKGQVVKVSSEEVLVDIGGKAEGVIPAEELTGRRIDPKEYVQVGREIIVEVLNEDKDGTIILSHKKARLDSELERLEKAHANGEIITAKVTEVVKGGLLVDVGLRGFVPASQVDRTFVEDLSQYVNQELRMKVLEFDKEKRKAVLSQRVVLEEEYEKVKEALWGQLQEGQTVKGTVRRLTNFGAFVDIGGIDGLLHVSEMGWNRVKHPSEVVKEGDELEVTILKVDRQKQKLSLSLKSLLKSPWQSVGEKYPVGKIVKGKVVRLAPFGAFVEVEPGIDGLVHISQISDKRVSKVEEVLTLGQTVDAKVIENDPEKKRLSLSLKEVVADKEKADYETYIDKQVESSGVTIGEILRESGKRP